MCNYLMLRWLYSPGKITCYNTQHCKVSIYIYRAPQDGATSLMLAAQGGHIEVVRLLLEKGANFKAVAQAPRVHTPLPPHPLPPVLLPATPSYVVPHSASTRSLAPSFPPPASLPLPCPPAASIREPLCCSRHEP